MQAAFHHHAEVAVEPGQMLGQLVVGQVASAGELASLVVQPNHRRLSLMHIQSYMFHFRSAPFKDESLIPYSP
jgi:hypothetical protein